MRGRWCFFGSCLIYTAIALCVHSGFGMGRGVSGLRLVVAPLYILANGKR